MGFWDGDGGPLLISERDAAVACLSEIEVFWDAISERMLVGLKTVICLHVPQLLVGRTGRLNVVVDAF